MSLAIECPKCGDVDTTVRQPSDPPSASRVLIVCPSCDQGGLHYPTFFDAEGRRLFAQDEIIRSAAKEAMVELAALVPDPARVTVADWLVSNTAEAVCLQRAFMALRAAVGSAGPTLKRGGGDA